LRHFQGIYFGPIGGHNEVPGAEGALVGPRRSRARARAHASIAEPTKKGEKLCKKIELAPHTHKQDRLFTRESRAPLTYCSLEVYLQYAEVGFGKLDFHLAHGRWPIASAPAPRLRYFAPRWSVAIGPSEVDESPTLYTNNWPMVLSGHDENTFFNGMVYSEFLGGTHMVDGTADSPSPL
jgi:hypothetical protein